MKNKIIAITLCLLMVLTSGSLSFATEIVASENTSTEGTGVTVISDDTEHPMINKIVLLKKGAKIYKDYAKTDKNYYEVTVSHKIKITEVFKDEENTEWYKFEFQGITNLIPGIASYKYVKADGITEKEPSENEEPTAPTVRDEETTVGDTSVIATGTIPSDVSLVAKEIEAKEYNNNIYNYIEKKSDLFFAFDISLKKGTGNEWQPGENEKVRVTLDAKSLGLNDGDKYCILHDNGSGDLESSGPYLVNDGKVSFETEGFSVFYGYTVDFEFNGEWYSIGGGSNIYLYELFALLGIEESTTEVKAINFTDESLIELSEREVDVHTGRTDWHLQSLKPFTTEEILTVEMNDGTQKYIKVYDLEYTALNGNKTLNNGDVINGATISKDANITLTLNGTVTIKNTINVQAGAKLTITGAGVLKRDSSFVGKLFNIEGGSLTISGENITLDGGAQWESKEVADSTREKLTVTAGKDTVSSAIYVDNSELTSNSKVNLTGIAIKNFYTKSGQAPAIHTTGDSGKTINPAVDNYFAEVNMEKVTIENCATMSGQSILLFNDAKATMEECTVRNNYSGGTYAGAIKAGGSGYFSQLNMIKCNASGNYSSGWGGVVLWAANNKAGSNESKATIDSCTLEGNKARYLGGALSNEAIMEVKDNTIRDNIAMAGGGIATFPFTLTDTHVTGQEACGLNLGNNNTITGNLAYATGEFTPFMYQDTDTSGTRKRTDANGNTVNENTYNADPRISDDVVIGTPKTYTGGGGGIWCYMNVADWKCTLIIGDDNTVTGNIAKNKGGGVYIDNVASRETALTVNGANISENTAVNGGGIALHETTLVINAGTINRNIAIQNGGGVFLESEGQTININNGSISYNTAVNGGGVYAVGGGSIAMHGSLEGSSGGALVVGNKAETSDEPIVNTAYQKNANELKGVGGGVYIADGGKFSLDGNSVGIYDNLASFAADDVFANGKGTKLEIPEVKAMTLEGLKITPNGWFEDYNDGDSQYANGLNGNAAIGGKRYKKAKINETVQVTVDQANAQNKYVCMTLGIGRGDLIINKTPSEGTVIDPDQYFSFRVTRVVEKEGLEPIDMIVTVKGTGSTTVHDLPYGEYEVKEITSWPWRYDPIAVKIDYEDGRKNASISKGDDVTVVTATNTLINKWWLSDQIGIKNIYGKGKVGE